VLLRREGELKIRVLLIRRHGRGTSDRRSCFAIHTGPDRPWIEHAELDDVRDVASLELDGLRDGTSVGLTPSGRALFAVCTHGRRDPCCAERGRPLASALSQAFPEETWESTHIGGDRFAGNMIAFPHGFYFGRVDPGLGIEVATGYLEGTVDLETLRGRSCRPIDVQAAEQHLRARHALTGVDDATVIDVRRSEAETFATFRTPIGMHEVVVLRVLGPAGRLTCHSATVGQPPRFELLRIEAI
jgi:hypothetical protein